MKKTIFLLVGLLATGNLFAQQVKVAARHVKPAIINRSVSGMVKDTAGESVPGAIVRLVAGKDSLLKYTDINGVFAYTNVKSASFKLSVTSLGYQSFTREYSNSAASKNIIVPTIALSPQNTMLNSVVINGDAGVVYKMDTVEYRAGNYKVRDNKLDDILKKMEGFEVNSDGSVAHNGKAITTLRLNGKAYAGGDVSAAIQNLPADIVEKVQLVDDYGDQASKIGIKSGDPDQILNITTNYDFPEVGDESYGKFYDNKYQNSKESPLSSFSVDVDNASYSTVRRFINSGQLPPKNAVRIEEMINYFKYQLPEPKGNDPVSITTEFAAAPWDNNHRLLRIGLKARTIPANRSAASNLVLLISTSGSMAAVNKLPLVQQSIKMLVEQLHAQDKVSIVVYNGAATLALLPTPGDQKEVINKVIDNLRAGGPSAGSAGIKLAYKIARENFAKTGNNRIVLATDGDFTAGAVSDENMGDLIAKERESGVALSVLGFGADNYRDSKLETLADKGNGNYAYIDNSGEAYKALVAGFGGTMFTVAKDVKLQVEFNPAKVQAYRLIGYENRMLAKEDFNNDKKDAGDMGSGHTVTALYEIIPAGIKDNYAGNVDELKYLKVEKKTSTSDEMLTVKFRYKDPQSEVSKVSETVLKDTPKDFDKQSADFRFAAAVAEVGMLLRDSEFKGGANYEQAVKIASLAKANDEEGYRSEFIRLVESLKLLQKAELAQY